MAKVTSWPWILPKIQKKNVLWTQKIHIAFYFFAFAARKSYVAERNSVTRFCLMLTFHIFSFIFITEDRYREKDVIHFRQDFLFWFFFFTFFFLVFLFYLIYYS